MNALERRRGAINRRDAINANKLVCTACSGLLDANYVCMKCGRHERISAKHRIRLISDEGSFKELLTELDTDYSVRFGYSEKYQRDKKRTEQESSTIVGRCKIFGQDVVVVAMERYFMVGTISKASGEKIASAFDYAAKHHLPIITFSAGGGIRIQEGVIGLVQMAKITASLTKFKETRQPFISVLTDPTYGGTTASFALVGDINIAEPDTSIGFGGKMLVKDILHENLEENFQTSEYVKSHGGVDLLVERRDLKDTVSKILHCLSANKHTKKDELIKPKFDHSSKNPADILSVIRAGQKPVGKDYVRKVLDDFLILGGDRISYDDPSIECGIGVIKGVKLVFIAQCKGRNLSENIQVNFGMTRPEGYRKAMRVAELADKYHLPILILLDSPGAHPGNVAEENNISIAISESMQKFLKIKTPVISIITGEGCSGGAIALSIADKLAMFSSSIYTVISPESYVSIMGDGLGKLNGELLEKMKLTARDLYEERLIDDILKDGDLEYNAEQIRNYFLASIAELKALTAEKLLSTRYNRVRNWDKK